MSGNSYKEAYLQAQKESKEALDRLKKASQDKTLSSTELNKYTHELAIAAKKANDTALQYRIYSDKQMLPEGTGEDKVREAIYNDSNVQKLLENGKKIGRE